MTLTERAYAKLNLTLDVLGKRPDGYHDLRMVMCSVELHDTVFVELGTGTDSCTVRATMGQAAACHSEERSDEESEKRDSSAPLRFAQNDRTESRAGLRATDDRSCGGNGIPEGDQNLAMKAARAYGEAAGIDFGGISIRIEKRIPSQAGLAGGSSDAAAVLRGLNRHYGRFSEEELREIGLQIGSDVPYCLFGGVALAEGRGEQLTRLPSLPEGLCFVLVKPEFSVSTPALFHALDKAREPSGAVGDDIPDAVGSRPANRADSAGPYGGGPATRADSVAQDIGPYGGGPEAGTDAMLQALRSGDAAAVGRALSNDFAKILAKEHPVVRILKRELLELGALGSELTGTGSVIYGLFDDFSLACEAGRTLSEDHGVAAMVLPG